MIPRSGGFPGVRAGAERGRVPPREKLKLPGGAGGTSVNERKEPRNGSDLTENDGEKCP